MRREGARIREDGSGRMECAMCDCSHYTHSDFEKSSYKETQHIVYVASPVGVQFDHSLNHSGIGGGAHIAQSLSFSLFYVYILDLHRVSVL